MVDLIRQKELDAGTRAIQQIELVRQLRNTDSENADGTKTIFLLKILEKIKETRLTFSEGSVAVLKKMIDY